MPRKFSASDLHYGRAAFHVWNRGLNRQQIFLDDDDAQKFLECLGRHLSPLVHRDRFGRAYRYLGDGVRLYAFALVGNHFHLIVEQLVPGGLERLMRSAMDAYARYFLQRHNRTGPLFSGPYRRRALKSAGEIRTAVAYVHDNHGSDCHCDRCSHRLYLAGREERPDWIDVDGALALFGGPEPYLNFRRDRARMKQLTT